MGAARTRQFSREKLHAKLWALHQARSQVCVAWVAKLPWRNQVVLNLRAYSILHVVTVKWIMCVQENIELLVCHKTKIELIHNFRRFLLRSYNNNAMIRKMQQNSQGWQKTGTLFPRGAFAIPCHPMATGLLCTFACRRRSWIALQLQLGRSMASEPLFMHNGNLLLSSSSKSYNVIFKSENNISARRAHRSHLLARKRSH